MNKKKNLKNKKNTLQAKLAFWLSLGFWIPLFNFGLSIASLALAIMALKKHYKDPRKNGGFGWALAALIISSSAIVLTIIGLIIYLNSDAICGSAICSAYNAG